MEENSIKAYFDCINESNRRCDINQDMLDFFGGHSLELFINANNCLSLPYDSSVKRNKAISGEIYYQNCLYNLSLIAKALNEEGIEYRILKGVAIAQTYPLPYTRVMSDYDILVNKADHQKAGEVLISIGYHPEYYDQTAKDITYHKANSLKVELHRQLFDVGEKSALFDLEQEVWNTYKELILFDVKVKFPEDRFHMKYQIVHLIKHFRERGCGLRFLLDLKYFSKYYDLSLYELIAFSDHIGCLKFYCGLLRLMTRYMNIEGFENERLMAISESRVDSMATYILENGTYGHRDEASETDYRYFKYKWKSKTSIMDAIRMALFPNTHELDPHFKYAKKYKGLLPIAWIHRYLYAAFGKKYSLQQKMFVLTKDKRALQEKVKLLKFLELD